MNSPTEFAFSIDLVGKEEARIVPARKYEPTKPGDSQDKSNARKEPIFPIWNMYIPAAVRQYIREHAGYDTVEVSAMLTEEDRVDYWQDQNTDADQPPQSNSSTHSASEKVDSEDAKPKLKNYVLRLTFMKNPALQ
jgi:hypothetical protein